MIKLLVVDSEPVYQQVIGLCLGDLPIEIKGAGDVDEAKLLFEQWKPDIVVLDVILKGGSGTALVRELKASRRDFVPFVFLTSREGDSVLAQCFRSGGSDVIPKPFYELLFRERIKAHIDQVHLVKQLTSTNSELTYYQSMIRREHQLAAQILAHAQRNNVVDNPSVAVHVQPADSFNGDLVLVGEGDNGHTYALIGDFTGHGLPASIGALPVSQAFFESLQRGESFEELIRHINRILCDILPDYMFCAGYLIERSNSGKLRIWGGGMPEAMIIDSAGQVRTIRPKHMPLGVVEDCMFETDTTDTQLAKGEILLCVSDGVVEARSPNGKMFGTQQVQSVAAGIYGDRSLTEAHRAMMSHLTDFIQTMKQQDDISLLALRNK